MIHQLADLKIKSNIKKYMDKTGGKGDEKKI